MINRLSLLHFVLIGLLIWGLPGTLVAGPMAAILAFTVAFPIWLALHFATSNKNVEIRGHCYEMRTFNLALLFAMFYLVVDALVGRQKFDQNMFLSASAVSTFMTQANDNVSRGRGIIDLTGGLLVFLPFSLLDATRSAPALYKLPLWVMVFLLTIYEVGISRGYLLMALIAIFLGATPSIWRLFVAGSLSLGIFGIASFVRGDFDDWTFQEPLLDAVVFPFINLALMINGGCGTADWSDFANEFIKKFMPSFLFSKQIFSFNIEMTGCIYPFIETGDIDSISIFTYLGELFYYQPSVVTAVLAGMLIAFLSTYANKLMTDLRLTSTRIFAGLMCIVLLRSRLQDELSFLIFLLIFVSLWRMAHRRLTHPPPVVNR